MVTDEEIDIYDANLRHLGVMGRRRAHIEGHWHKTFHCWIVNGTGQGALLFQQRSAESTSFPNTLDISAAGHLLAGEHPLQGAREILEELGVGLDLSSLVDLGFRIEAIDEPGGDRNREYQAVFIARFDAPLSSYQPSTNEVSGLFWMPLNAGLKLFSGVLNSTNVDGIIQIGNTGEWRPAERTLSLEDFLPRIPKYYLTICIMAERLLKGEQTLAVS